MAGSAIKRARREIAEQALLRAATKHAVDNAILKAHELTEAGVFGIDAVTLMAPVAEALHKQALTGDVTAIREVLDRVSGKVAQEIISDPIGLEDLESALTQISERRRARALAAQNLPALPAGPERAITPSGTDEAV